MKSETLPVKSKEAILFVLEMMEKNLSDKYTYHSIKHTQRVISAAESIGESEGLSPRSLEMLRLSAAWHDCGYLDGPFGHEENSCVMVRRYLPDFGFSDSQVEEICKIIMATKIPNHPEGLQEEIICDADLNYLGTVDYGEIAESLYKEFIAFGIINSHENWIIQQISFFEKHRYYTKTAKSLYDVTKRENLERLKKGIRNNIFL